MMIFGIGDSIKDTKVIIEYYWMLLVILVNLQNKLHKQVQGIHDTFLFKPPEGRTEAESTGPLEDWLGLGHSSDPGMYQTNLEVLVMGPPSWPKHSHPCAPRLFGRGLHGIYQYFIVYQCASATHLHNLYSKI